MKILFANVHMQKFGGSELVTLELAEHFQEMGWDVLIYSPAIGGQLDLSHVPHTDRIPSLKDWDLVWSHQNLLISAVDCPTITNHMSSYVDEEVPRYDPHKPIFIFANSAETRSIMQPDYRSRCDLFQNPAPRSFEGARQSDEYGLFISNHPPREVIHAAVSVGPVKLVGANQMERVTRETFKGAKYIVCNGKSVQYALRAGVPVYLYDHFGGPGWLTGENFDIAEWFNFSGRGFNEKKTESQIREDLNNVPEALVCGPKFKLESRIMEIIRCLQS